MKRWRKSFLLAAIVALFGVTISLVPQNPSARADNDDDRVLCYPSLNGGPKWLQNPITGHYEILVAVSLGCSVDKVPDDGGEGFTLPSSWKILGAIIRISEGPHRKPGEKQNGQYIKHIDNTCEENDFLPQGFHHWHVQGKNAYNMECGTMFFDANSLGGYPTTYDWKFLAFIRYEYCADDGQCFDSQKTTPESGTAPLYWGPDYPARPNKEWEPPHERANGNDPTACDTSIVPTGVTDSGASGPAITEPGPTGTGPTVTFPSGPSGTSFAC